MLKKIVPVLAIAGLGAGLAPGAAEARLPCWQHWLCIVGGVIVEQAAKGAFQAAPAPQQHAPPPRPPMPPMHCRIFDVCRIVQTGPCRADGYGRVWCPRARECRRMRECR